MVDSSNNSTVNIRWIVCSLWLCAASLGVLAVFKLTRGIESHSIAFGFGAVVFVAGAWLLQRPERMSRCLWGIPAQVLAVWSVWGCVAIATVVAYGCTTWDEADYLLSGMALRGMGTPYIAGRAPVAGLVAAVFADVPMLANAVLLLGLIALLSVWSIRRWGRIVAFLPLAFLATQNVFYERIFGLNSELPAALLLVAAYGLLGRERFLASGVCFAFSGLARWNLAVIPLVVAACVAARFGWRCALRFCVGGFVVLCLFAGLSSVFAPTTLVEIIADNLAASMAWSEPGTAPPDFLSRLSFYLQHWFYFTPPALIAVGWALLTWKRCGLRETGDWCIRLAVPAGIIGYLFAMLNVGGHLPRFMAPVLPLALLVFVELLVSMKKPWALVLSCITLAWGAWPADIIPLVRGKLAHRHVFTSALREAVSQTVPRDADFFAPAIAPLCDSAGVPAMVELRRFFFFPNANRNQNGEIVPFSDPGEALSALIKDGSKGAFYLIPSAQRAELHDGQIVGGDESWIIWRTP